MINLITPYFLKVNLQISSLSDSSPEFEVYLVDPLSSERIPAALTCQGVLKSGSPTPKDITPSIVLAISKNFLMPEGFMPWTVLDKTLL